MTVIILSLHRSELFVAISSAAAGRSPSAYPPLPPHSCISTTVDLLTTQRLYNKFLDRCQRSKGTLEPGFMTFYSWSQPAFCPSPSSPCWPLYGDPGPPLWHLHHQGALLADFLTVSRDTAVVCCDSCSAILCPHRWLMVLQLPMIRCC